MGCYALTEPGAGSDAASLRCSCVRSGDHRVLNGTKQFITNAPEADLAIVYATKDPAMRTRGICAFGVEKGFPGYGVGKHEDKMGIRGSTTASIVLESCQVPEANLLHEEGRGFTVAMVTLDGGRIGIASQAQGIARAALEAALDYSKQCEQFGAPISALQAIQWKLADMATRIDAVRLLIRRAAWIKDQSENHTIGELQIDTAVCALYPHGSWLSIMVGDEYHRIEFDRSCSGSIAYRYYGPERGTVLSLDAGRTVNGSHLTSSTMELASGILENGGWRARTTDRFTAGNIADAEVLFTGLVITDFTDEELVAVEAYVRQGGGLVVVLENPEVTPGPAASLAALFGVEYDLERQHGGFGPSTVNAIGWHPIWQGAAGLASRYEVIAPLAILSPSANFIGINDFDGSAALAALEYHEGRVVLLTDIDAFNGHTSYDPVAPAAGNSNAVVWENIFEWVAGDVD